MSAPRQNQFAAKPESKKLSDGICITAHPKQKASWLRSARRIGMKLSAWVRETLDERARKA